MLNETNLHGYQHTGVNHIIDNTHSALLLDRLILLPGGVVAFVEVKTTGKQPSVRQLWVHGKLKVLGFRVEVLDSKEGINNFINSYR